MVHVHVKHSLGVPVYQCHLFAVRDLATRFADGRLTNQKLLDANDEQLFELLTAVYGIGKVSQLSLPLATSSKSSYPLVDRWA